MWETPEHAQRNKDYSIVDAILQSQRFFWIKKGAQRAQTWRVIFTAQEHSKVSGSNSMFVFTLFPSFTALEIEIWNLDFQFQGTEK